jgi:hypothetical protein
MSEKPCSPQIRAGRLAKAKQFLAAAGLIEDSASGDVADAYVTLCVHSGIAAADVICCARLGRYAHGDSHAEAIALLRKARAADSARRLEVLLGMKSKAGYTHLPSSTTDLKRAGRAAKDLVEAAERAS